MNKRKRYSILFVSILFGLTLAAQAPQQYGIKCGTFYYSVQSTINIPGTPSLKVTATGKSCFDEYGIKEATQYTETADPDEAMLRHTKHYFSLRLPDYYCLINTDTNEKVDERDLSNTTKEILAQHRITNYDSLSDIEAEIYSSQFVGTTVYLAKNCKKYKITEKTPLYGSEDIVVVWNNIVLHRISKTSCFQYEYKVTKIDENIPEDTTFKIPE
nr:hypothetical protein [uncultured Bacteroides sp.]